MDNKLKKLRFSILAYLKEEHVNCLNNIDNIEILHDSWLFASIALRVTGHVWGENMGEFKYPADWWQAFKGRYFPYWILKRYPVKYNTVQAAVIYPEYKPALEDETHRKIFLRS